MNIISIIPASEGSKNIPGKNFIPICGKPLIGWTIEQSIKTKLIKQTFVISDNIEIAEISEQFGAKIIKWPDSDGDNFVSSEIVLMHALDIIKANFHIEPDLIVFLQASLPLRKQNDIKDCINKLLYDDSDSIFSGCLYGDFPIWELSENKWQSLNYDYFNMGARQQITPKFAENGSIYVFKPDILTKFNNRLGGKISIFEMEFWQTWKIDNSEDIKIVESLMYTKIIHSSSPKISLNEIELIVYDFDGVMTDNTAIVDENGKESVRINRSDGLAISYFKKAGKNQLIISTEKNRVIQKRAEKLQIDYFNNIENKKDFLLDYVKGHKISLKEVLYLGNDINDLEAMKIVGFSVCPNDAFPEIKSISKIVLEKGGGQGVIRNLYELLK
jgi:YrbI family 3-deoxy-D-manno-octulosonate 8-phosphate phosphatase